MLRRKGQAATEYLMTYGWALLAIAIVGALLYTQVFSQRACGVEGANGFNMVSTVVPTGLFVLDETGNGQVNVQIELENKMDRNVTVTSIELDGQTITANLQLEPGQTGSVSGTVTISGAKEGKCFSLKTKIVYDTDTVTGLVNSGTLSGKYA